MRYFTNITGRNLTIFTNYFHVNSEPRRKAKIRTPWKRWQSSHCLCFLLQAQVPSGYNLPLRVTRVQHRQSLYPALGLTFILYGSGTCIGKGDEEKGMAGGGEAEVGKGETRPQKGVEYIYYIRQVQVNSNNIFWWYILINFRLWWSMCALPCMVMVDSDWRNLLRCFSLSLEIGLFLCELRNTFLLVWTW